MFAALSVTHVSTACGRQKPDYHCPPLRLGTVQDHMCQLLKSGQWKRSVLPPYNASQEAGWHAGGVYSLRDATALSK